MKLAIYNRRIHELAFCRDDGASSMTRCVPISRSGSPGLSSDQNKKKTSVLSVLALKEVVRKLPCPHFLYFYTPEMGLARRMTILFVVVSFCCYVSSSTASEDVEFKDPHLVELANFAATSLLKDAELGLNNRSTLHRIMDAQIVPFTQPNVIII